MRRSLVVAFPVVLAGAMVLQAEKPRKPTPALPAAQYAAHDEHPNEKVTIAAEPGDIKETRPNTRLDYFHHGFMPIRVIISNDSDTAINLDEARIQFISATSDVIPAADDDELQRRLFSKKSTAESKIPILGIPIHHKPVDQQILQDDGDFGFASTTIEPHTTASGYLFYDIRELDDPVLEKAQLEIRKVRFAKTNKELYSFQIPLKPTPEAKPDPARPATAKPTDEKPTSAKSLAAKPTH